VKQKSFKTIKNSLLAGLAGTGLLLSANSVLALSIEPIIVSEQASPSVMQGIRHAQSSRPNRDRQFQSNSERKRAVRSRSEVVQEVKRRHSGAEVLKISLSRNGTTYNVRVLMPNGKVRSLQVSALR